MKVLVTGGAGYIGSHTLSHMLKAGYTPVVYDNLSTGFREAVSAGVVFIQGDIRDSLALAQTFKNYRIEAVIHFAAKLVVPESVIKPLEYYDNNVLGTLRLLEACQAFSVDKFIFSSTAAVYGNPEIVPVPEDAPLMPLSPYGASKAMSERILADLALVGGPRYTILRYFNVAGAAVEGGNGQRTKQATHLMKVATEAACGKRTQVEIFGTDYPTDDGTGIRDYIHVDDLAAAHVRALEYLKAGGQSEVFNVGYGRGFSVREVLSSVTRVARNQFFIKESPRRIGDAAVVIADSHKIQKVLDWHPLYADLDLICKTALEWERNNL